MMNYDDLASAYRLEKGSPTLQPLSPSFYQDARKLCESPEAREYRDNMLKTLADLYHVRVNKIVHIAGRNEGPRKSPENVTEEERGLYDELSNALEKTRNDILRSPIKQEKERKPEEMVRVRLSSAMPQIVGTDGNEYGPFNEGDVTGLPKSTADLLVDRGAARKED